MDDGLQYDNLAEVQAEPVVDEGEEVFFDDESEIGAKKGKKQSRLGGSVASFGKTSKARATGKRLVIEGSDDDDHSVSNDSLLHYTAPGRAPAARSRGGRSKIAIQISDDEPEPDEDEFRF